MTKKISLVALLLAVFAVNASAQPTVFTLEDALKVALSENASVKVADAEITRTKYAQRGTYASLFPQIDASAAYQRTIKKQVMYMDGGFNLGGMTGEDSGPSDGIAIGRLNTWTAGISAAMPIVNFQLWESIRVSGSDVELAVEKARASRLDMVSQVKQAFYGVLLAKEVREVYGEVFDNAARNFRTTEMKYHAQKASELDLTRARANLENTVPNLFNAEASVDIALWQLKAVMGIDLDTEIDVAGSLSDYVSELDSSSTAGMTSCSHSGPSYSHSGPSYSHSGLSYSHSGPSYSHPGLSYSHSGPSYSHSGLDPESPDLSGNSTLRQLAIQAEQLASAVRIQQDAYLPSLNLAFAYNYNAMANDFEFRSYRWSPYSYVGLTLQIPIFSGGKRLNQLRQAKVQQAEFAIQRQETERQLRIALRQYITTMETAVKSYGAAQAAVATASKAYDIAASSYEVGRSTLTDLGDAQLALTQSRLSSSQCIYNYLAAKTGLEQTLGADYTAE